MGGVLSQCSAITPPLLCSTAAEEWHRMGGEPWQLIEPVDGFHPSQVKSLRRWQGEVWRVGCQCLPAVSGCPAEGMVDYGISLF